MSEGEPTPHLIVFGSTGLTRIEMVPNGEGGWVNADPIEAARTESIEYSGITLQNGQSLDVTWTSVQEHD